MLLYNANMRGFVTGDIFVGNTKTVCLPGMNCYSCPGAIGACPLGSIQNALAESKTKAPTYVLGIIYYIVLSLEDGYVDGCVRVDYFKNYFIKLKPLN